MTGSGRIRVCQGSGGIAGSNPWSGALRKTCSAGSAAVASAVLNHASLAWRS
jgi:hypothetical protein